MKRRGLRERVEFHKRALVQTPDEAAKFLLTCALTPGDQDGMAATDQFSVSCYVEEEHYDEFLFRVDQFRPRVSIRARVQPCIRIDKRWARSMTIDREWTDEQFTRTAICMFKKAARESWRRGLCDAIYQVGRAISLDELSLCRMLTKHLSILRPNAFETSVSSNGDVMSRPYYKSISVGDAEWLLSNLMGITQEENQTLLLLQSLGHSVTGTNPLDFSSLKR